MDITQYIRDIKDFPKEGVVFKDITPLLLSPTATRQVVKEFILMLKDQKIDKVVGMESRGFFFATLLAQELNAGFIPVRKPNKLPHTKIQEKYELEYGFDTLEMHSDAIAPGDKILIHDDVLATGGTAEAVCKLVERLGGEIRSVKFSEELGFLNWKK